MRRVVSLALALIAIRAYADCQATSPASPYTVDVHSPACWASAPCLQNTPIHFSVTPPSGGCYIPFYGPCKPYVIDSCDTLTWHFGDGTPPQVVHGSGEVDHVFPTPGYFEVEVDIANARGTGTVHGSAYICAVPVTVVRFTKTTYDVPESGGSVTVTLERSGDLSRPFTLDYLTLPNWPPGDFVRNLEPLAMKVSFSPGETVKAITHRVQDDAVFTGDSTHSISVQSDGAVVMENSFVAIATIHVADDDAGPELSIDDVTVPEGDLSVWIEIPVHLSAPAADRVYAWCSAHDGTARAGVDYQPGANPVTFEPGQTSAACRVLILGNFKAEPDKTFTVSTEPVLGPVIVKKGTALCTLKNDDAPEQPPVEPPPAQSLAFIPATLRTSRTTETVMLQSAIAETVSLRSSAPEVVQVEPSVSAPGAVRLVILKPGVATITATADTAVATLGVVVVPPPRRRAAH